MIAFGSYKILPYDMQVDLLLEFGVWMELVRNTSQLSIELYTLENFYVEIYFDRVTEDPLFLKAFDSVEELEPYFPLIHIDGLFELN